VYEPQNLVLTENVLPRTSTLKLRWRLLEMRRSGRSHAGQTPIWRWPVGQGQLYGWEGRTAWLPRVTERECTKGLPRESTIDTSGWAGFTSLI